MGESSEILKSTSFISPFPRPPTPPREKWDDVKANNEFPLTFSLPGMGGKAEEHLVVMLNGLNEPNRLLYDHEEVGLSRLFKDSNIASVLLPLPFHFERWPGTAVFGRLNVVHLILRDMVRFFLGYRQIIADVGKLTRDIKGGGDVEYTEWFGVGTKVHLFGYSIGGLGALSAFVNDYMKGRNSFQTCMLLCSGANFKTLDPGGVGIPKKYWERFLSYYDRRFDPEVDGIDVSQPGFRIFERIVRGKEDREIDEILSQLSHRILIVIGSKDDVNSPDSILPLVPEDTGLAVLQIPSLRHLLVGSSAWGEWSRFVVRCAADFMTYHAAKPVL